MTLDTAARRRSVFACIVAVTTMSIVLGLCWPLLALILDRQGVSPGLNGLSAGAQMIAVLPIMRIAPVLIGRFGSAGAIMTGTGLMAAGLMLLPVFENVWAWFPIRFVIGLGAELVFIASDIWINQLAQERTRGRLIGVYGLFISGGFLAGPLALVAFGSEDWTVLYLAVGVALLGLGILAAIRPSASDLDEEPRARFLHFMRVAPTLVTAGLMYGLIGSAAETLLVVYGVKKGLLEDSATLLLAAYVVGWLLIQLPAGWLADRVEGRRLLISGAVTTLLAFVILPFSLIHPISMWSVMIVMGGGVGISFVVAMTMMGRRYQGVELIGINTSFGFAFGLGATLGPGLSGFSMDLTGPDGMPFMGTVLCGLFLLILLRSKEERVPIPTAEG